MLTSSSSSSSLSSESSLNKSSFKNSMFLYFSGAGCSCLGVAVFCPLSVPVTPVAGDDVVVLRALELVGGALTGVTGGCTLGG
jgi:hypothetical protein